MNTFTKKLKNCVIKTAHNLVFAFKMLCIALAFIAVFTTCLTITTSTIGAIVSLIVPVPDYDLGANSPFWEKYFTHGVMTFVVLFCTIGIAGILTVIARSLKAFWDEC